MDQGIPVFTNGVTSRGHEFTNFTQIPQLEGETAGKIVLDWMKANNKDLKVFAVSGGDPTQFWAQGRMKGFHETIAKAISDAKFVTTEANGLNVSYNDPGQTYDTYRTFLLGQSGRTIHRECRHWRRTCRSRDHEPEQSWPSVQTIRAGMSPRASSTKSIRAFR